MKTKLLFVLFCIFLSTNGYCDQVHLSVKSNNQTTNGNGHRSPIIIPNVNQEGHTFVINQSFSDDVVVNVLNGESIVYTVMVPAGTNQIILPDSLQGNYEFDLIHGSYCFYGDILL
jgi:hypothetical protein